MVASAYLYPRISIWRDDSERSQLYQLLYSKSAQERARGVRKMRAYSTRGPVSHALESTALFVAALLDEQSSTDYAARLAYSSAIVRFVNGMLDREQQSEYAQPLVFLAKNIGLPVAFVELRHACTHEELPSLTYLRASVQSALEWLRREYWEHFDGDDDSPAENAAGQSDSSVKELFRSWRRAVREYLKSDDRQINFQDEEVSRVVDRIEQAYEDDKEQLLTVMISKNVLVPAYGSSTSVSQAVVLYWPLICEMQARTSSFAGDLARSIFQEVPKAQSDLERSHLLHWAGQLLGEKGRFAEWTWRALFGAELRFEDLRRIVESLGETESLPFELGTLLGDFKDLCKARKTASTRQISEITNGIRTQSQVLERAKRIKTDGWTPRPIGEW